MKFLFGSKFDVNFYKIEIYKFYLSIEVNRIPLQSTKDDYSTSSAITLFIKLLLLGLILLDLSSKFEDQSHIINR
jgi:hypothetical protein